MMELLNDIEFPEQINKNWQEYIYFYNTFIFQSLR